MSCFLIALDPSLKATGGPCVRLRDHQDRGAFIYLKASSRIQRLLKFLAESDLLDKSQSARLSLVLEA